MSVAEVFSLVLARLDYLLEEHGGGGRFQFSEQSELESVQKVRNDLETLQLHLPPTELIRQLRRNYSQIGLIDLLYDVENSAEYVLVPAGGRKSPRKRTFEIKCLLFKRLVWNNHNNHLLSINIKRIQEVKACYQVVASHEQGMINQNVVEIERDAIIWSRRSHEFKGDVIGGERRSKGYETPDDITDMVGMDGLMNGLRNHFSSTGSARIVILGMFGSGKTTVALRLLHTLGSFDFRVWVTVSKSFDARDVVETIMYGFLKTCSEDKSKWDEIGKLETDWLLKMLSQVTNTHRCLIVLDDVWLSFIEDVFWKTLVEDCMKKATILITTREKQVANHFKLDDVYQVPRLTVEESSKLFLKKISPVGLESSDNVDEVLSWCDGFPIAIIDAARYIRGYKTWDGKDMMSKTTVIRDAVGPSYECLPVLEKLCLLYLGLFPPHQQIPLEKLYLLWMAEGVVSNRDLAEQYLSDLADRDLVVTMQDEYGLRSCCAAHNLVRLFCQLEGEKERYLRAYDVKIAVEEELVGYRIAIYLDSSKLPSGSFDDLNKYIYYEQRALLIFGIDDHEIRSRSYQWRDREQTVTNFKCFKWMKTLDFNAIDFRRDDNKFPHGIDELVYLRYLGFRDCYLDELALSCSNFPFLETLDLRVRSSSRSMIIPNVLWKLTRLRHLYFPIAYQTDGKQEKLKLNGLRCLEILENFHLGVCDVNDLVHMKNNLQIFTMIADGTCEPDLVQLATVVELNRPYLPISSVTLLNFNCCSSQRIELLSGFLASYSLQALHLEGQIEKMPRGRAYHTIIKIVFDGCEFTDDPMPDLGQLIHLRNLVLCNNAIYVDKICCPRSSFSKLKSLKLANLQSLKIWIVERKAMGGLAVLIFERCPILEPFPEELMTIKSLKKIEIGSMPKRFQEKVIDMLRCNADLKSKGKAHETVSDDSDFDYLPPLLR